MTLSLRTIFLAVFFAFGISLQPVQAQWDPQLPDPNEIRQRDVIAPPQVLSDGAFRHQIGIEVPAYRNLAPELSLDYNSTRNGNGVPESWLGPGWQLNGLSSIERMRPGGGLASFNGSIDIFALDGEPLLACNGSGATNPWSNLPNSYPSAYVTTRESASCQSGGNMVTLLDNYNRIVATTSTANGYAYRVFTITRPDGLRYTYLPIGAIIGLDPTTLSDARKQMAFQRKFLLTEIRDTQSISDGPTNYQNVVRFQYFFDGAANGYAHRVAQIDYGSGYNLQFSYTNVSTLAGNLPPLATFAVSLRETNTGFAQGMGQQYFRLNSIRVSDGSIPIRAYALNYELSQITRRSLLASVQQYGADFTFADGVLSGSTLPAVTFDYRTDNLTFALQQYEDAGFHSDLMTTDLDDDGYVACCRFCGQQVKLT